MAFILSWLVTIPVFLNLLPKVFCFVVNLLSVAVAMRLLNAFGYMTVPASLTLVYF